MLDDAVVVPCGCNTCKDIARTKQGWGTGPWMDEPDCVEFTRSGFPCTLHRNVVGAWCGFVGLSPKHPFYGMNAYAIKNAIAHAGIPFGVYGGITAVLNDRVRELWWLGFSADHKWNICPAERLSYNDCNFSSGFQLPESRNTPRLHYWTVTEMLLECTRFASQLALMMR